MSWSLLISSHLRVADSSYHYSFFLLQSATGIEGAQDPFFGAGSVIFQVFSKVSLHTLPFTRPETEPVSRFSQLYIVAVFVILICSLGNRPQGSNAMFTSCIVLFGVLQVMLLYCAGWVVYNA